MSKIAVLLSGGVDSSVALMLLQREGHTVFGITMRHLSEECFDLWEGSCCSRAAVLSASRLCEKIGVKHYVFDFNTEFEEQVIKPSALYYSSGITPNPCVVCNEAMKFGSLLEKAVELGAEYVASGHYARSDGGRLLRAKDIDRDQSYFLYRLSAEQLQKTIFPIGEYTKKEVRELARNMNIEAAERKDSMEICFAPEGDFSIVFRRFAPEAMKPGNILDEAGNVIGTHKGIGRVTIGQRKGLGLKNYPDKYVISIDAGSNSIVVGPRPSASRIKVHSIVKRKEIKEAVVKVRSTHKGENARLEFIDENIAEILFDEPVENITPGQSAVFYSGEEVVGGGVIDK